MAKRGAAKRPRSRFERLTWNTPGFAGVIFIESNPFVFSNTDAECDYLVSGEAEFDSSVVMEPGVTLVFTRSSSMEISGTLTATGTEDLPITLMAEVASDGYWNGLVIGGVGNLLEHVEIRDCLLYTSPSPRDLSTSRMPSSA